MEYKNLIDKAVIAKKRAIAPFSNFAVGAALLTLSGKIYSGCNIESSSFGLTMCAERVALYKALSEGEKEFIAIAVATNGEKLCPPCGACRQVLWDFCKNIHIILVDSKNSCKELKLSELFPYAFDSDFLINEQK